jgi:hypothetical protein
MTRHRNFKVDAKIVRDSLQEAIDLSKEIHHKEAALVSMLKEIDKKRYYVRFGYKSLKSFCIKDLNFSMTQAQRIVTKVRRSDSSDNSNTGELHQKPLVF